MGFDSCAWDSFVRVGMVLALFAACCWPIMCGAIVTELNCERSNDLLYLISRGAYLYLLLLLSYTHVTRIVSSTYHAIAVAVAAICLITLLLLLTTYLCLSGAAAACSLTYLLMLTYMSTTYYSAGAATACSYPTYLCLLLLTYYVCICYAAATYVLLVFVLVLLSCYCSLWQSGRLPSSREVTGTSPRQRRGD